jgi:NAD(P)H dehydrogenase (quinone)
LSGRKIAALELPRDEWTPTLLRASLSANHAQLITDFYDTHNAGPIDVEAGVGEQRFSTSGLAEVHASILPHAQALAR